jgi:hypothetical protein
MIHTSLNSKAHELANLSKPCRNDHKHPKLPVLVLVLVLILAF